jgi:hypothetical protein
MTTTNHTPKSDSSALSPDATMAVAEAVQQCLERIARRETPWLVSVQQLRDQLQHYRPGGEDKNLSGEGAR